MEYFFTLQWTRCQVLQRTISILMFHNWFNICTVPGAWVLSDVGTASMTCLCLRNSPLPKQWIERCPKLLVEGFRYQEQIWSQHKSLESHKYPVWPLEQVGEGADVHETQIRVWVERSGFQNLACGRAEVWPNHVRFNERCPRRINPSSLAWMGLDYGLGENLPLLRVRFAIGSSWFSLFGPPPSLPPVLPPVYPGSCSPWHCHQVWPCNPDQYRCYHRQYC